MHKWNCGMEETTVFGDGPAMADSLSELTCISMNVPGHIPLQQEHSIYNLPVCEICVSVPSPSRNVINLGSDRQCQIPGCHPKRSGKAVWALEYLWLWNVCLLRNREGIHADKSDVGLRKRQKAMNSARVLFHYMPGLYCITSPLVI